jgi:hypothetical protein
LARFGDGGSSDLGETGPVGIVLLPAHVTPRVHHLTLRRNSNALPENPPAGSGKHAREAGICRMAERPPPHYASRCVSPARTPHMAWWKIALIAWLAAMALMVWFLYRSKGTHG